MVEKNAKILHNHFKLVFYTCRAKIFQITMFKPLPELLNDVRLVDPCTLSIDQNNTWNKTCSYTHFLIQKELHQNFYK